MRVQFPVVALPDPLIGNVFAPCQLLYILESTSAHGRRERGAELRH